MSSQEFRAGDWNCATCSNHNFSSRTVCKQCNAANPTPNSETGRPGDWNCARCTYMNFAKNTACKMCETPKDGVATASATISTAQGGGGESPTKRARLEASSVGGVGGDGDAFEYQDVDDVDADDVGAEDDENLTLLAPLPPASSAAFVPLVSTTAPPVKRYYLAVDIERSGPEFTRGILAIGACFGTSDGTILLQRAFCAKVPTPEAFEKRCWVEFWVKFPAVLARIDAESVDDPIGDFRTWALALQSKYGPFGRRFKATTEFRLVSDNPAYDIGMMNLEFFKHGFTHSLAEMFDDYVPTDDPSERVRGLTAEQRARVEALCTAPHDHWPVNDATRIFQQRCAFESVVAK